jgi:hypothetical protein
LCVPLPSSLGIMYDGLLLLCCRFLLCDKVCCCVPVGMASGERYDRMLARGGRVHLCKRAHISVPSNSKRNVSCGDRIHCGMLFLVSFVFYLRRGGKESVCRNLSFGDRIHCGMLFFASFVFDADGKLWDSVNPDRVSLTDIRSKYPIWDFIMIAWNNSYRIQSYRITLFDML